MIPFTQSVQPTQRSKYDRILVARAAGVTPIEFRARREALGLGQSALAEQLGVSQVTVSRWESGASRIPDGIDGELRELEDLVMDLMERAFAAGGGVDPVFFVWGDDRSFWAAHPEMDGIPAVLHRVAMARAAAECAGATLGLKP